MDLQPLIPRLGIRVREVDLASMALEQSQSGNGKGAAGVIIVKRRGRKSMGADERLQVSERMKTYWAANRDRTT